MFEFIGWIKRDEKSEPVRPMTPALFDALF